MAVTAPDTTSPCRLRFTRKWLRAAKGERLRILGIPRSLVGGYINGNEIGKQEHSQCELLGGGMISSKE